MLCDIFVERFRSFVFRCIQEILGNPLNLRILKACYALAVGYSLPVSDCVLQFASTRLKMVASRNFQMFLGDCITLIPTFIAIL